MSSISTRATLNNVNVEVYRAMAPAQGFHPEADWVTEKTGWFLTRDDQFISKKEQADLNPFMQEVANDVRKECAGMCPSEVLYKEASRRMKLAIRKVAGKKGTRDGKLLSKAEINRIQNPLLRSMVERATEKRAAEAPSNSSSWSSDSSSGSERGGHGPHYYGDDVGVCGRGSGSDPGWGPDGPNRSHSGSSWGPDGPSRGYGGSSRGYDDFSGGSGTTYINGYPLI